MTLKEQETEAFPPLTTAIYRKWGNQSNTPLPSSGALEELLRSFAQLEDRVTELEGKRSQA